MTAFGTLADGSPVERFSLTGGGLSAQVLTYGAVLQDLRLDGHPAPLVLGFPEFAPYLDRSPYFGATAGRCANRIRDGHLSLEGQSYQLNTNFMGKHCLHGGAASFGKRLWQLAEQEAQRLILRLHSPDGDMGFPGALDAELQFSLLDGGVLDIVMTATCKAPTLCNLAHHSYFVLDDSGSVQDHLLQVDAEHYLPVDGELIPTGAQAPVAGTRYDFRSPASVGQAPAGTPELLDHNFCLAQDRQALRKVARLTSRRSGVSMELRTTEPGLQVYDGAKVNIDTPGLAGQPMRAHAGIALEPQIWPDANHHPSFAQAVLRPGEVYRQHSQFIFTKDER